MTVERSRSQRDLQQSLAAKVWAAGAVGQHGAHDTVTDRATRYGRRASRSFRLRRSPGTRLPRRHPARARTSDLPMYPQLARRVGGWTIAIHTPPKSFQIAAGSDAFAGFLSSVASLAGAKHGGEHRSRSQRSRYHCEWARRRACSASSHDPDSCVPRSETLAKRS